METPGPASPPKEELQEKFISRRIVPKWQSKPLPQTGAA
jgi:hypothetical protein